jgi:aspartate dehydrogenase
MLLPSGAIAGLDAIKAAHMAGITRATLITTKPPQGFKDNPFLIRRGIDLSRIKKETLLFNGSVNDAVKRFPQNINVAAALALAVGDARKVRVKIVVSPGLRRNTHEVVIESASGRIMTKVENEPCPDNPKTSYLAVLSAIAALKQFAGSVRIGS